MKEELIQKLEDLLKEEVTTETFAQADDLKNQYLQKSEEMNNETLQNFLKEGGLVENFETQKDPNDSRFSELMHILSDRESKFRKMRTDEIVTKQKEKEKVIADLEKINC